VLRSVLISIPLSLAVALSAFIADETLAASPPLAVELVSSGILAPEDVRYEWTDQGLKINGRIAKRLRRSGRIIGHAEIELLDADGRILVRHAAPLQRFMPRRKNPEWASFHATIPNPPAEVVLIRVRHVVET